MSRKIKEILRAETENSFFLTSTNLRADVYKRIDVVYHPRCRQGLLYVKMMIGQLVEYDPYQPYHGSRILYIHDSGRYYRTNIETPSVGTIGRGLFLTKNIFTVRLIPGLAEARKKFAVDYQEEFKAAFTPLHNRL